MSEAWTTEDELEYLDTIGTNSEFCIGHSEYDMYKGYMNGLRKRTDWGNLDRRKIIAAVAEHLRISK